MCRSECRFGCRIGWAASLIEDLCHMKVCSCLFHSFVKKCVYISPDMTLSVLSLDLYLSNDVRVNVTDLRVVSLVDIVDLIVESLAELLVESPVYLHVDPGEEPLVDGLVDLIVEWLTDLE